MFIIYLLAKLFVKAKLEAELDRLESEGIIWKSNFSEWASSVVPALKADGSLGICGDFKSTFNGSSRGSVHDS